MYSRAARAVRHYFSLKWELNHYLRSCQTRSRPAAPLGATAAFGSSASTSESETLTFESASGGNTNTESLVRFGRVSAQGDLLYKVTIDGTFQNFCQLFGPSLSHGPSLPASLTLSPKSVTNVIVTMRGGAPALHRDGNGGLKNTRQFLLGSVLHSLAIPWCVLFRMQSLRFSPLVMGGFAGGGGAASVREQ